MTDAKAVAPESTVLAATGTILALALAIVAAGLPPTLVNAAVAVVLAAGGLAALSTVLLKRAPSLLAIAIDVVVIAAFVVWRDPNAKLWSLPGTWPDLLRLTPIGA